MRNFLLLKANIEPERNLSNVKIILPKIFGPKDLKNEMISQKVLFSAMLMYLFLSVFFHADCNKKLKDSSCNKMCLTVIWFNDKAVLISQSHLICLGIKQ